MGAGQSRNLCEAAASNEIERARHFIREDKTAINKADKDGWTPLHFAAYGGSLDVARELLAQGAITGAGDTGGRTPLHLAALQGRNEVAAALLAAGAEVDAADSHKMTPLHKAAVQGNAETARLLLDAGANVNVKLSDGSTPLALAAWKGHAEVVKLLLSRGANYRTVKNDGQTAMHEAAAAGQTEVVQLLLDVGASPQAQDEEGYTPAMVASKAGHTRLAAVIGGGRFDGEREWRVPPTPAPSLEAQLPGSTQYPAQRPGAPAPSAPPLPVAAILEEQPISWQALPVAYPAIYRPGQDQGAPHAAPPQGPPAEASANAGWWREHLGRDLSGPDAPRPPPPLRSHPVPDATPAPGGRAADDELQRAAAAWNLGGAPAAGDGHAPQAKKPGPFDSREQFEANLLKQAQGVWRRLHGQKANPNPEDKAKEAAAKQAREREAAEADAEWAGAGAKAPAQQRYTLDPYEPEDEDDYEQKPGKGKAAGGQAEGLVRRKLAELELEVDKQQGWVRGGTKQQAAHAQEQAARLKAQEAQLAAMRKQLEAMQGASAGRLPRRDRDGRAPVEYICPITQEVMTDPTVAADGFTYERSAIMQWLQLGHVTSPMTNQPLPHPGLTPNRALNGASVEPE
ncbi:hypothetical protein WJX81_005966 [Elliptochloris bilobata]|uniref:U-box domain-containing protein n=1 Tax=Elliptochloris bilobata TaxID=381761 RepID=A0AAW1QDM3_9CHLO